MAEDETPGCPFCPSMDFLMMEDDGKFYMLCLECRACGPCTDSHEDAMLAWCEREDDYNDGFGRATKVFPLS